MPRAIALRPDFTGQQLRGLARRSKDASQARRLLALAVISDGGTRSEAARLGNVTLQIVRDWVLRFNAEGAARSDRPARGRPDTAAERCPQGGAGRDTGTRPDACDPWRGAMAALRSGAMAVGGVPSFRLGANAEPGDARHGLAQAFRAPQAPRPGRRRDRCF